MMEDDYLTEEELSEIEDHDRRRKERGTYYSDACRCCGWDFCIWER